jgi:hypothetical protein
MSGPVRDPDPAVREEPTAAGERVGVIDGDRLCTGCGFNLHGQTITREPHYSALIVRCPECGMAAALQEYPLLGRWVKRLALLVAATWLLIIISGVGLYALTFYGLSASSVQAGSGALTEVIGERYVAWQNDMIERHKDDPNAPNALVRYPLLSDVLSRTQAGQNPYYGPGYVDPTWLEEQDQMVFLRDSGGVLGALASAQPTAWAFYGLLAFAMGAAMSVALLHQPSWRVAVIALIPIGAALLAILHFTPDANPWQTTAYWTALVAQRILWLRLGLIALTYFGVSTIAGIFTGRPLARAIVRGAIPPRLRGPLTFLWTAKGLPPPRTRQ